MRMSMAVLLLVVSCGLCAAAVSVPPMPECAYADTEVTTNLPFAVGRDDTRELDVRIELEPSLTNNVQIAFGADADGDGDLSPEETSMVVGWRRGRWFVENVKTGDRRFAAESEPESRLRSFRYAVKTYGPSRPAEVAFECDGVPRFADAASASWSFDTSWNLMKLVRRGISSDEWCTVRNQQFGTLIFLR